MGASKDAFEREEPHCYVFPLSPPDLMERETTFKVVLLLPYQGLSKRAKKVQYRPSYQEYVHVK